MAAASGHPPSHRANCRELFPLLRVVTRSHIAGVGWFMVAPLVLFVVFLALLPASEATAAENGIASSYPYSYKGRRTASGERFNPHAMTCAHNRHPFGSMLRITAGGRSITCRVTDRGPFIRGRVIDLTPVGARALGFSGLARVVIERM